MTYGDDSFDYAPININRFAFGRIVISIQAARFVVLQLINNKAETIWAIANS